MKNLITSFFCVILFSSCRYKEVNVVYEDIISEIQTNKSNVVFLELYPGISDAAYNYILKKQSHSNERLIYNSNIEKFIYQMKINDSLIDFKILNNPNNIELNLSKEVHVKEADENHYKNKEQYENILSFLLEVFANKYKITKLSSDEYYLFFEPDVFDKFEYESDSLNNVFFEMIGKPSDNMNLEHLNNSLYSGRQYLKRDNLYNFFSLKDESDNLTLLSAHFYDKRIDPNVISEHTYNVNQYVFQFSFYTKESYERMKNNINKEKLQEIQVEQERRDRIKMKLEKERNDIIGDI